MSSSREKLEPPCHLQTFNYPKYIFRYFVQISDFSVVANGLANFLKFSGFDVDGKILQIYSGIRSAMHQKTLRCEKLIEPFVSEMLEKLKRKKLMGQPNITSFPIYFGM